MRVAIIDCGTNTVRLLIADAGPESGLREVARDLIFARLGQGVDATGRFHPDALDRTFAAVETYAAIIKDSHVDKVRFVATSAARDVSNRDEFFRGVEERLGVAPDVVSGEEEAELSFLGALSGGAAHPEEAVLVVDIGGGSTELVRGTGSGQIHAEASLDMGSVRIRERFLHHDPPTESEISAAREFVGDLLDASAVRFDQIGTYIGVAGTVTSLSGMNLGLTTYDRQKVHNSILSCAQIESLSTRLLTLPVADTMRDYPSLQPMRAQVICAGALICAELSRRVARPMVVRETDILDGAALKLMRS